MSEIMEQDDEVKIPTKEICEQVPKLTAEIEDKLKAIKGLSFSAQVAKLTEEIGDKLDAIKGESDSGRVVAKLTEKIADKLAVVEGASDDLSIYRVPNELRKVKADAYNPRLVSIGPFHRGNTELASMVEPKWRYLLYFLQRTKDYAASRKCLEDCNMSLYKLDQKIRRNYAEKIEDDYDKDKLTELLLLDGCFILELFLRREEHSSNMKLEGKIDPIFNNAWMIPALQQDLALLENQIPFFVLKELYRVIKPHICSFTPPDSVTSLALKFFLPTNEMAQTEEDRDTEDCNHLLDLLHKFYLPPSLEAIPNNGGDHRQASINFTIKLAPQTTSQLLTDASGTSQNKRFRLGASQLLESGIELQKGSPKDHLLDITFHKGILKIPPIFIKQTTDSLFRNFIAFEQCHLKVSPHITSYAILMKCLIRSEEDIKLLQNREILNQIWTEDKVDINQLRNMEIINQIWTGDKVDINQLRNMEIIKQIWTEDKDLIDFDNILEHVHPKDFRYGTLCLEVKDYTESWFHWHKHKVFWKVRLRRYIKSFYMKYFSNPWSMIAFFAAVTVFGLTLIQAYYNILSH